MPDYTIEELDSSNIKVRVKDIMQKSCLISLLSKFPVTSSCPPIVQKKWDGQIKLYNLYSQKIYAGLESYIVKFCEERGYTIELPKNAQKRNGQKPT